MESCRVADITYDFSTDSCCQLESCNIPCSSIWKPSHDLSTSFGIPVVVAIALYCIVGLAFLYRIRGKVVNFFVAGRSLGIFVATLALAGQSIDSNVTLGNVDLAYKYHWFDGASLPIGLGLSLLLNGLLCARSINKAQCLTLPDFYAQKYGPLFEVLVSIVLCTSFIVLLAGNLVGLGRILEFCFGNMGQTGAVFVAAVVCASYSIGGGLVSVVYADVVQALTGILGLIVFSAYLLQNRDQHFPPPSVGFPEYTYPNQSICNMYNGVPGSSPDICVYNADIWGPNGVDNGAWPLGDKAIVADQFSSVDGMAPFPNAVFYSWATVFILGFGNLSALDFQARCMASKSPNTAAIACFLAACITFAVGVPFAFMGGFVRLNYGPDSAFASFEPNTCSSVLDLPTCAQWLPDKDAFLKFATSNVPSVLGVWALIGIVAASMSTCTGVILAIGTVLSHNVGQKLISQFFPIIVVTEKMLLFTVRLSIPIVTCIAAIVASQYNETGKLLIVAFDIALAGTIAPLLASIHSPNWVTPSGAVLGLLSGIITRVVLEFSLPKDESLILPYGDYAYGYGAGQSGLPGFVDSPGQSWDPETCNAPQLEDWSGFDSLGSPLVCALVMYLASFYEIKSGKSLLWFLPSYMLAPTLIKSSLSDSENKTISASQTQSYVEIHRPL